MNSQYVRIPNLLSPAGNMECLKSAVSAGCDEVYFGGQQFNARQGAGNFSIEEMKEAVRYCRLHGVKTCLTVNTIVKEEEWEAFTQAMDAMAATGIHAIIVQDMGVAQYVHTHYPQIELHGSTQMSIHSLEGALYLQQQGFQRVVLARELSLEEVRYIRERCSIELEVFIHGALCYSYSGQCLMSSLIGGRSGNRGRCAQPCRLPYRGEDGKERHLMNLKDMCSLSLIPELIDIGVNSLKIEGRLKGPEYVYGVTDAYRKALDNVLADIDSEKKKLAQLFNRGGFTEGYWTQNPHMIESGSPKHQGIRIGSVQGFRKGQILIDSDVELHPLDVIEIRTDKPPYPSYQLQKKNLDKHGCWITVEGAVRKGMDVYRLIDHELVREFASQHDANPIPIVICGDFHIDKPAVVTAIYNHETVTAEGMIISAASGRPMTEEDLKKQLTKTGGTPFTVSECYIAADDHLFIPVSALNALRREVLTKLEEKLVLYNSAKSGLYLQEPDYRNSEMRRIEVVISGIEQWNALKQHKDWAVPVHTWFRMECFSTSQLQSMVIEADEHRISWGISLPYIQKSQSSERVTDNLKSVSTNCDVLVHNPGQLEMLKNTGHACVLDYTIPITNRYSLGYWLQHAKQVTLSTELTVQELEQLPPSASTAIIYGQIPVMFSEQCVRKEQGRCRRSFGYSTIQDRKNASWICEHHCDDCYTALYPKDPLWMADRSKVLQRLPVTSYRLMFLQESAETTAFVLQEYAKALHGERTQEPDFLYQRGHFYKSIE